MNYQSILDAITMLLLPFAPAYLLYKRLPSKTILKGLKGPWGEIKLDFSGAFAGYVVLVVLTGIYIISPGTAKHELAQKTKDLEDLRGKLNEYEAKDRTGMEHAKAELQAQCSKLENEKVELEKRVLQCESNKTEHPDIWKVSGDLRVEGAEVKDTLIETLPPADIDDNGHFELYVARTYGRETGKLEWPSLRLRQAGYESRTVPLSVTSGLGEFYQPEIIPQSHQISLHRVVVLERKRPQQKHQVASASESTVKIPKKQ